VNEVELLSEEQLDFLSEMMNIGAGNAATALTQMLRDVVNIEIPAVHVVPVPEVPSVFDDPSLPVACVRMGMIGDVVGELFFIVPDEQKANLIHLAEREDWGGAHLRNAEHEIPNGKPLTPQSTVDLSVLAEMGNILAGVYLTAIHDFCKLNIYHSAPTIAVDMIQSLIDESIVALGYEVQRAVLIENEFILKENRIRTFLLIVPAAQSLKALVDSVEQARTAYREG